MPLEVGYGEFSSALVGVFRCSCGKEASRFGLAAGTLPEGWTRRRGENGAEEPVCPTCSQARPAPTRTR
jgi:hypothetical protein